MLRSAKRCAAAAALAACAMFARAGTIPVTDTGAASGGTCTLGQAIYAANLANNPGNATPAGATTIAPLSNSAITAVGVGSCAGATAGANRIVLPDAASISFNTDSPHNFWYGPNALPPIARNIVVNGNGATLTVVPGTSPRLRFFFIGADPQSAATPGYNTPGPGTLTLHNLTLTGGRQHGGDTTQDGAGAGMGGAIYNQGTLNLDAATLAANSASGGSGFGGGTIGGGGMAGDGGMGGAVPQGIAEAGSNSSGSASVGGAGGGAANGTAGAGSSGGGGGAGSAGDGGGGGGDGNGYFVAGGGGGGFGGGPGGSPAGGGFGIHGGPTIGGGGGVGGGGGFASSSLGSGGGGFAGGGGANASAAPGGQGGFGGGGGAPYGGGYGGGTAYPNHGGGGGGGFGGAIFNHAGILNLLNSTLAGNSAAGGPSVFNNVGGEGGSGLGGAIFNLNGTVTVAFSTLAANTVSGGGRSILATAAHTAARSIRSPTTAPSAAAA